MSTLKELPLDGAKWQSKDDVYNSFFRAVGAPDWPGRNLDALNDSIAHGSINEVEVPYRLVIRHYNKIGAGAKQMADNFIDLIREIAADGCPVEIRVENT
ncbi:MAG: barstar family protein [Terriglobales bacterium]